MLTGILAKRRNHGLRFRRSVHRQTAGFGASKEEHGSGIVVAVVAVAVVVVVVVH